MEAEKTFVAITSKNTNVSCAMARAYAVTGINGADARSASKNIKADQVYGFVVCYKDVVRCIG
jgi:hypothetical protein